MTLHRLVPGIEISICDGKSGRDSGLSGFARASLEVPLVLFEPETDLYGCVSELHFEM